jgi:hypothetical protein
VSQAAEHPTAMNARGPHPGCDARPSCKPRSSKQSVADREAVSLMSPMLWSRVARDGCASVYILELMNLFALQAVSQMNSYVRRKLF